jgi:aldose sugar dehydrogenase
MTYIPAPGRYGVLAFRYASARNLGDRMPRLPRDRTRGGATRRSAICITVSVALSIAVGTVAPAAAGTRSPLTVGTQIVLSNLAFPDGFTFFPDGRLLFGERFTGKIKIYDPSKHVTTTFFTVPNLTTSGEQGLLGLAVHPDYPATPSVYAFASRLLGGKPYNQVLRITDSNGTGTDMTVIASIPSALNNPHDGGRILFGPDGKLYAVVGEGGVPANAQSLGTDQGKVLRMDDDGSVPSDNPFPGKLIFTFGMRNSYGFAFDPRTSLLWETENGPECNDEINIEKSGENHAWGPNETCSGTAPKDTNQDGPLPRVLPLQWYTPTIAPTGMAFCTRCGLPGGDGKMYFGAYNTGALRRVGLTSDRLGISSVAVVYTHSEGILSVEQGPDGALYFSDSHHIYKLIAA